MTKSTNYKGVSYKKDVKKWRSYLTHKGKRIDCGSFDTEIEAIKGIDLKIMKLGLPSSLLQIFKPKNNATTI